MSIALSIEALSQAAFSPRRIRAYPVTRTFQPYANCTEVERYLKVDRLTLESSCGPRRYYGWRMAGGHSLT